MHLFAEQELSSQPCRIKIHSWLPNFPHPSVLCFSSLIWAREHLLLLSNSWKSGVFASHSEIYLLPSNTKWRMLCQASVKEKRPLVCGSCSLNGSQNMVLRTIFQDHTLVSITGQQGASKCSGMGHGSGCSHLFFVPRVQLLRGHRGFIQQF